MSQKTKEDWLKAGARLLAEFGPQGVTVDALCRHLGVTKGSFYHHFAGYDAFKAALLAFYEEEGTLQIIDQLAEAPTATEKLSGLLDIIVAASTTSLSRLEITIRAWALHDEAVREVQTRVDQRRLGYVESLCREISGDSERAQIVARTLYAILVGSEQMQPPVQGDTLRALFDEYLASLKEFSVSMERGPRR